MFEENKLNFFLIICNLMKVFEVILWCMIYMVWVILWGMSLFEWRSFYYKKVCGFFFVKGR